MFSIFFFTTVTAEHVENLHPPPNVYQVTSTLFQHFYIRVISDILQVAIRPVSEVLIYKELCHLNSFKITWLDDIPAQFVKDVATVLSKPITYIVKFSITSSIVSEEPSRSHRSWIYSYLCNQCPSPLNVVSSNLTRARCTRYNIMW